MDNETEHVTRCPKCFGRDVRPSRKGGLLDSIMSKLGRSPFRCRGCQSRFYVYVPHDEEEEELETEETAESESEETDEEEEEEPAPDLTKTASPRLRPR